MTGTKANSKENDFRSVFVILCYFAHASVVSENHA